VLCHANVSFASGPYTYAISALPGQFSTGFPLSALMNGSGSSKKTTKKNTAKKAKAKAKGKKKSKR
jgi:hypothetical protein